MTSVPNVQHAYHKPQASAMLRPRLGLASRSLRHPSNYVCPSCIRAGTRFSTRPRARQQGQGPFRTRLRAALRNTKVQWKPIPVGLGIAFLGAVQFYRVQERERKRAQDEVEAQEKLNDEAGHRDRPKKRKRIRYDSTDRSIQAMLTFIQSERPLASSNNVNAASEIGVEALGTL